MDKRERVERTEPSTEALETCEDWWPYSDTMRVKMALVLDNFADAAIAAYEAALAEEEPSEAEIKAAAEAIARCALLKAGLNPKKLPQYPREYTSRELALYRKEARDALRAARKVRKG